jgi:hypothetical protein
MVVECRIRILCWRHFRNIVFWPWKSRRTDFLQRSRQEDGIIHVVLGRFNPIFYW